MKDLDMTTIENHETWSIASAKNKLSEVIEKAQDTPQVITRHGKPNAIVVSIDEWARKTKRKSGLIEFLRNSPLCDEELDLERIHDNPRGIKF